jgi:hypothetical protein
MLRTILICCGIVLLFDAAAASIAKAAGFPYMAFAIPELVMYVLMGFVLERTAGFGAPTIAPVTVAALIESTLGWWISVSLGVGHRPTEDLGLTAFSAVTAALLFTALGGVGMWIGYGFNRASRKSDVA